MTAPLHIACQSFLYFLEHGHSIDETDGYNGSSCLHSASVIGSLLIVQCFINIGANIEAKDDFEWTPLHIACLYGHLPTVQYLIEKGANIEAKDDFERTPLHLAALNGKTDVVKFLVSKEANKNAKDCEGKTPYDVACFGLGADKSQRDIIKELLK